uniref:N-acetylneuraminate lyase n=1 Tax=Plectus sambesii TaxID=2011161 RepID=A0A914UJQ3_9BILA
MKWSKTNGLIAATLTPFHQDGSVNLDIIGRYVDHLLSIGITQVFVNGTAGEHASLTVEEREAIAERWIKEGKGKLTRIIIQVGTLNLPDSQRLAAHAEAIGADGISVITPCYYAT